MKGGGGGDQKALRCAIPNSYPPTWQLLADFDDSVYPHPPAQRRGKATVKMTPRTPAFLISLPGHPGNSIFPHPLGIHQVNNLKVEWLIDGLDSSMRRTTGTDRSGLPTTITIMECEAFRYDQQQHLGISVKATKKKNKNTIHHWENRVAPQ